MCKSELAAFLLLCASTATVASQTIAKMQLPCESPFQVLSPVGTQLAVQCKGNSLRLIDVPDGTQQTSILAARGVNTFVYSPDGRWLAVGFDDGTVDVISSRDKVPSKHWQASSHRIDELYFFPDSKAIFVGPVGSPGTVWDTANTPALRATLPGDFGGISACAVSSDGKLLAAAGDDTVVRWYDTATWQKIREYRGFLLETFALKFTQDAKQLLAGAPTRTLPCSTSPPQKRLVNYRRRLARILA